MNSRTMNNGTAVQIIASENHQLQLNIEEFQRIFGSGHLDDHYVVVISIAGALRTGKSFILNFFLKYLRAQYKKCDLENWMGEHVQQGFKWRGGKNPETKGIWIWPEIFTHREWNDDKLAIILLDTQGTSDNESSTNDCTSIFAMSMLLSSVHCFNVMRNVEEDKLQFLELCMNYAQLATKDSHDAAFQKLLFIVRDWQNADEYEFGHCTEYLNDILAENASQTPEMRELRKQIHKSFEQIDAYLMAHPGKSVSQNQNFNGDLKSIKQDYVEQVEALVQSICAPHNLIVKRINRKKMNVSEFTTLLKKYVAIFRSGKLPEARAILRVTADITFNKLHVDCPKAYLKEMERVISFNNDKFYDESDLVKVHDNAWLKASSLFKDSAFGERKQIFEELRKLVEKISDYYASFKKRNERIENTKKGEMKESIDQMRVTLAGTGVAAYAARWRIAGTLLSVGSGLLGFEDFNDKVASFALCFKCENLQWYNDQAKAFLEELPKDCLRTYSEQMHEYINSTKPYVEEEDLREIHNNLKKESLEQLYYESSGFKRYQWTLHSHDLEAKIVSKFEEIRQKNESKAINFFYNLRMDCKGIYARKMEKTFNSTISYLRESDLQKLHDESKNESLQLFMKEAGNLQRRSREMQILTDTALAKEYDNFLRINQKRVETFLNTVREECISMYSVKMQNMFDATQSFIEATHLKTTHKTANDESLALFKEKAVDFKENRMETQTLVNGLLRCYDDFFLLNEKRAQAFFNQLRADCLDRYAWNMNDVFHDDEFRDEGGYLKEADLSTLHNASMDKSMALFKEKSGDSERCPSEMQVLSTMILSEYADFRQLNHERFEEFLSDMRQQCIYVYERKMFSVFLSLSSNSYLEEANLQNLHEIAQKKCFAEFKKKFAGFEDSSQQMQYLRQEVLKSYHEFQLSNKMRIESFRKSSQDSNLQDLERRDRTNFQQKSKTFRKSKKSKKKLL